MDHRGERLKKARLQAGLTQLELADMVGVTKGAVSAWENGKTKTLKDENMMRVAKSCRVNYVWLITGLGEMLSKNKELSTTAELIASLFDSLPPEIKSIVWQIISTQVTEKIDRRLIKTEVPKERRSVKNS